MAKTFTLQSKSYDGRYLKLSCTQTIDISTNTSTIAWTLESLGGSVNYYYTGPTTLTINGTQVYYRARTGAHEFPCAKGSTSGTLIVSHATDGKKSIEVSLKTAIYTKTVSTNSDTWTLDDIPRQANITSAPNFNDEENPTISYTNPAGWAVEALDACISLDGRVDDIAYRPIPKDGTSYTFTLTEAERDVLRNATQGPGNSRTVLFYVRTNINGTLYHSTEWRTLTVINADPIIEPTITDTNADTAGLTGGDALIRYFSNAYFTTGAKAQKGASITAQSVTCGGVTLDGPAGTFFGVQSSEFVFTATDNRGNTTTLTVHMPFVEYVQLTCSIGNNKPDTDGNFALTASGVCYNGDITGAGSNDLYVLYRYKISGGSYSDWMEMAVTRNGSAYTAAVNVTGLDYRTTYIFQCKAVDLVDTATTEETAIKSMPVFDWSENDFRFNVPVAVPRLELGGVPLDYIVLQGTGEFWSYRLWDSGVAECWGCMSVSTTITTAWGALYVSDALINSDVEFPFEFMGIPNINVNLTCNGEGAFLLPAGALAPPTTKTTGAFVLASGTSSATSNSYSLNYHIKGRWK